MNEVVTLEPWSPWPLVLPALVVLGGAVVSIVGTRGRSKPLRESGYVAIAFQAVRDGVRVRGVLVGVGGNRWEVRGVAEDGDAE